MNALRGIAALVLGPLFAAAFGLVAGVAIGLCVLLLPFAWAWDALRKGWERINRKHSAMGRTP